MNLQNRNLQLRVTLVLPEKMFRAELPSDPAVGNCSGRAFEQGMIDGCVIEIEVRSIPLMKQLGSGN